MSAKYEPIRLIGVKNVREAFAAAADSDAAGQGSAETP